MKMRRLYGMPQNHQRILRGEKEDDSQAECKLLNSLQPFLNIKDNNMVFKKITDYI